MLLELRVSEFALIEDLGLFLNPGLNVLSGETGAGKSIVIGAINLLLGERAAAEQVRQGRDAAQVEGIFNVTAVLPELLPLLEQAGIAGEEELIIAREVQAGGRSIGRVQGRAVPAAFLKELGRLLVDLHGQHQHQSLLKSEQHLTLLDSFGGEELSECRNSVAALYRKQQELKRELSALGSAAAERERRVDILAFQIREIETAGLCSGEEEELLRQEKILAHAEKLNALISQAYAGIYSGDEALGRAAAMDGIDSSRGALEEAAEIDRSLTPLAELLASVAAQLDEVSMDLRDYRSRIEFDPAELATLQERLDRIRVLKRKYGQTVEAVLSFAEEASSEMARLLNCETLAREIERQLAALESRLKDASLQLREIRQKTAAILEEMLKRSFVELALPGARISVSFAPREHFSAKGIDQVEFLFSANPGELLKPLVKVISGGEISRLMLALKTALARQDRIPTLIFDEVDAGIGGATVQVVAEKLALLSRNHQVICVTHSPQIAAMADNHILLYKQPSGERISTRAEPLTEWRRREELARMLDGADLGQVSLQHADSLLARAVRFKEESRQT
ncbi:MAG: DNA repair protein RecN [Dethiobacter sp.]|nr:DNA repair protein RecN [Dethiobacter sp.]